MLIYKLRDKTLHPKPCLYPTQVYSPGMYMDPLDRDAELPGRGGRGRGRGRGRSASGDSERESPSGRRGGRGQSRGCGGAAAAKRAAAADAADATPAVVYVGVRTDAEVRSSFAVRFHGNEGCAWTCRGFRLSAPCFIEL